LYEVGKYGDSEEQSLALREKFAQGSIWIREGQVEKKSKSADAAYKKDLSFVGCDAAAICVMSAELQEIVHPPKARAADIEIQLKYDRAMACWDLWRDAWRLLNNKIDSTDAGAREDI
jgi:hypothetical protein